MGIDLALIKKGLRLTGRFRIARLILSIDLALIKKGLRLRKPVCLLFPFLY